MGMYIQLFIMSKAILVRFPVHAMTIIVLILIAFKGSDYFGFQSRFGHADLYQRKSRCLVL